jgi:hypothetical protein
MLNIEKLDGKVFCGSMSDGFPPENVLSDDETCWKAEPYYQWIMLDLKKCCFVTNIHLAFGGEDDYYRYHVDYSNDRINWHFLFEKSDSEHEPPVGRDYTVEKEARYIRLTVSYHSKDRTVTVKNFTAFGRNADAAPVEKDITAAKVKAVYSSEIHGFTQKETEEIEPGFTLKALHSDKPGAWVKFEGVDFKDGVFDQVRMMTGIECKGQYLTLEFRLDGLEGPLVGKIHLAKQWKKWSELAIEVLDTGDKRITGVHDLYAVLSELPETQEFWMAWLTMGEHPTLSEKILDYREDLPATEETGEYRVFFGDMHSHTSFSDGSATPEVAYDYAKNVAKMDFLGITEHSNCLDEPFDCDKSRKFRDIKATAERMTENGCFVCLYGSETTYYNRFGHVNLYCADFYINSYEFKYDDTLKYYEKLKQYPHVINQWNHPWSCGDRHLDMFKPYDPELDKITCTMELHDIENTEDTILKYYVAALDEGWHIAPVGNQDNHLENWGTQNDMRTAVIAKNLTAGHIYDAMKKRRVYFSGAPGIRVLFSVNGNIQGSIIKGGEPLVMRLRGKLDEGEFERVDVYGEHETVLLSKPLSGNLVDINATLPEGSRYYFLKVVRKDGKFAVTAPVWVEA